VPVTKDVTILQLSKDNLEIKKNSTKKCILHRDLRESIYMEIPKGMKVEDDECLF
jgi:hypothetical protein